MADLKIVLHVDRADRWPAAISNLKNLAWGYPQTKIRVVADGASVCIFQGENDLHRALAQAAEAGVESQLRANFLREHAIAPESLPRYTRIVPAGVTALAEAQAEGFACVKP